MSTLKSKIQNMEKDAIVKALNECDWVKARAARKIGITERMIGYKIKKYGIKKEVAIDEVNGSDQVSNTNNFTGGIEK